MDDRIRHVVDFYTRHPISAEHILIRLRDVHGSLDGLTPDALFPYDQDHYGGLEANRALAEAVSLNAGAEVADFCAGLGGPARWWATNYDARVTGFELNPDRVAGAEELTRLVGLEERVRVLQADVLDPPADDGSFDIVFSQEAFLHVPDKARLLSQAFRILRPGGKLAFTDWVVHRPLNQGETEDMWRGIAAQSLLGAEKYRQIIEGAGFGAPTIVDLTEEWGTILADRLKMYRRLRQQASAAGTPAGDDAFFDSYVRLVAHVQDRKLGGIRVFAKKPG